MEIEKLKKNYEELLPWDKYKFCNWIKTQEAFEIKDEDLTDVWLNFEKYSDRWTDSELLDVVDGTSILDEVFYRGLETDVLKAYDEENLTWFLQHNMPELKNKLFSESDILKIIKDIKNTIKEEGELSDEEMAEKIHDRLSNDYYEN